MLTPTLQHREFYFTSADGLRIACMRWDSIGPVRGLVQIAHGSGEYIGRYVGLIEYLTQAGFVVYGNDHRGHGRTARSASDFGIFGPGGFDLLVEDMTRLTAIAKEEHPETPLVLLGHGMGSFAAQQCVIDYSALIEGLALSGSGVLDRLWRRHHPASVDAHLNDPLCLDWLQPSAVESFFATASLLADPARLRQIREDLPVYAFSGSEDPVGQQLKGVCTLIERYQAAGVRNISHDFYPGGRHEMLYGINRDHVRANLLRWINGVLSGNSRRGARKMDKTCLKRRPPLGSIGLELGRAADTLYKT